MRTTQAWLVLIITAATAAGMLSFLVATPDQASRVRAQDLGFGALRGERVADAMSSAGAYHRAAHARTVGTRAAGQAAKRWTSALPGSAGGARRLPTDVVSAPASRGAASKRVAALVRWVDGLPAARTRVATGPATAVEGAEHTWTVTGEFRIDLVQSRARARSQAVPFELTLRGGRVDARGVPRRWVVEDVTVSGGVGSGGIRAFADPVIVGSSRVDVVAPASATPEAESVARVVAASLDPITRRYADASPAPVLAAWLVVRRGDARRITRSPHAADAAHPIAWVDSRGDVFVDLSAWRDAAEAARTGAVRHAVTHAMTTDVVDRAPALVAEGIALAEEHRVGDDILLSPTELAELDVAFSTRTSHIAELVVAPSSASLEGVVEAAAATATIAWMLEARGTRRLHAYVAQLDGGLAPDAALRRSMGLTPRGLELQVAAWTRARLAAMRGLREQTDPQLEGSDA